MICYIQRLEKQVFVIEIGFLYIPFKITIFKRLFQSIFLNFEKKNCSTKAKVNVVLSIYFGIILLYMNFKSLRVEHKIEFRP
jgi:hypothetical protein